MRDKIFVLGAPDPEMAAIEALLSECGVPFVYAAVGGARVHPGNAYKTEGLLDTVARPVQLTGQSLEICAVECGGPALDGVPRVTHVDHHRPGDPGYGKPPQDFLEASSIGQVISVLAAHCGLPAEWPRETREVSGINRQSAGDLTVSSVVLHRSTGVCTVGESLDGMRPERSYSWGRPSVTSVRIPQRLLLTAAADHCLGAAYRGECPGVKPDALMEFRAESRAAFQGRDVSEVLTDIASTTQAIREAPVVVLDDYACPWHEGSHPHARKGGCTNYAGTEYADDPCWSIVVADMRREPPYPELPEAATRANMPYISGPLQTRDGRLKITCSGSSEVIDAFMDQWAPSEGLTDIYGDPARGFAGGYLP